MTQYDPNLDPADRRETIVTETIVTPAHVTETVETVVVRDSNTGWWIAGILGGVVLIAVLWILFARGAGPQNDEALLEAQLDAAAAQAQADSALIQGQVAGAQASVDIARADAARSQADAVRAASDARAAEARASTPVIIEREVQAPPQGQAIVTPTAPQN
ncbi:MAG: hypothetical protein Q8R45_10400 [Brevundimonas sp.]|uniref:hypothetical protein n=1 Tax=Brevundimonas sp. TaxID=1871086 RepID=UPI0027215667|nr:hypothetical protein [Brevundimonas sp.]MDO9587934.1 hypothetical protein [Brevundimonas sp.]MDP3369366.1 hypothetical protein [Brevundimonas sp.]MDP3657359.1 hypothetical protein [Brevundimonas sp.]MDZ4111916.1 hypothetical protein [Brevundimonas sp.]